MDPSHGRAKAGGVARTYIHQLCASTGCSLEDLPEAMDDRERWQERVREISADGNDILSLSASHHSDSTESLDSLSPSFPIVHHS